MVYDKQSIPTTPTSIPTTISVFDMDNELRIRREQLKQMNDDHDAPSLFSLTTARKRSSSYVLPLLLDIGDLPRKKRFLVTPNSDDLGRWTRFNPYADHDTSEENTFSCEELQGGPAGVTRTSIEDDLAPIDDPQQELAHHGPRLNWDEPISFRGLRPRKLHFAFNASSGTQVEWKPDTSEFLPFMPL